MPAAVWLNGSLFNGALHPLSACSAATSLCCRLLCCARVRWWSALAAWWKRLWRTRSYRNNYDDIACGWNTLWDSSEHGVRTGLLQHLFGAVSKPLFGSKLANDCKERIPQEQSFFCVLVKQLTGFVLTLGMGWLVSKDFHNQLVEVVCSLHFHSFGWPTPFHHFVQSHFVFVLCLFLSLYIVCYTIPKRAIIWTWLDLTSTNGPLTLAPQCFAFH